MEVFVRAIAFPCVVLEHPLVKPFRGSPVEPIAPNFQFQMERTRGEKRRKFHQALLNLYHPLTPPPSSPVRQPQLAEEESVAMVSGCMDLDLDPEDADNVEKESLPSDTGDSVPQKLTRAQRKRIRKRKLKEAASVRRKIVGPLLPSAYQNLEDEPHVRQWKEKLCDPAQKPTQESSGQDNS